MACVSAISIFFPVSMPRTATAASPRRTRLQIQTTEVLTRIEKILGRQQLGLGNLCRTFMFMPGTKYRPGYGEARKKVYQGIFAEDAFPPNSGIYIRSLGENILLRSMAIAYRGEQKIVASPNVRLAPGSFSQSVRVSDWLLLAGQDAVTFDRVVECEGNLAGQTEATLRHTKDIVEAAGGSMDDIVKTTVYLTKGTNRPEFAAAYRRFLHHPSPHTRYAAAAHGNRRRTITALSGRNRFNRLSWAKLIRRSDQPPKRNTKDISRTYVDG